MTFPIRPQCRTVRQSYCMGQTPLIELVKSVSAMANIMNSINQSDIKVRNRIKRYHDEIINCENQNDTIDQDTAL